MRPVRHPSLRGVAGGLAAIGLALAAWSPAPAARQEDAAVIAPLAALSLLLDADFAGDAIVAVGERGHVLKSRDQGGSWQQVPVPTRVTLTAVSFRGDGLGVAVGHDATILRTLDGGDSWQRVHFEPEQERPLLDVAMLGAQTVVAVGAYGYYLQSRDGGATWSEREITALEPGAGDEPPDETLPEDFHFNAFAASESGRWYIAAEAGNLYRSDDAGGRWRRLPSPYEGSFMGLVPLDDDRLLALGLQGVMFASEDAGETWRGHRTGTTATLTRGLVLADGRVLVAGYSGSILTMPPDLSDIALTRLDRRKGIAAVLQLRSGDLLLLGTEGPQRVSLELLAE